MKKEGGSCVDLGTAQCPCHLAERGDCLICSRLQGKDCCECHWEGTCPYTLYVQNGFRASPFRRERIAPLKQRKEYKEGITVLVLEVGMGFAQAASLPGSFVFLQSAKPKEGEPSFYQVPISLLRTEEERGRIHLAIRKEGAKTKALLQEENPVYMVRGVYGNGILGSKKLQREVLKGKRILIITKGIGATAALLFMDHIGPLIQRGETEIRWLADDEKMDRALLEEYGSVTPEYVCLRRLMEEKENLEQKIGEAPFEIAMVMASEYYTERIGNAVRRVNPRGILLQNNNGRMCCGEGICGACTVVREDGTISKGCKCNQGQ